MKLYAGTTHNTCHQVPKYSVDSVPLSYHPRPQIGHCSEVGGRDGVSVRGVAQGSKKADARRSYLTQDQDGGGVLHITH